MDPATHYNVFGCLLILGVLAAVLVLLGVGIGIGAAIWA